MNADLLNVVMPYVVGPSLGAAAVLLFFGIRYALALPASARKREVAVIGGLIASAIVGAYQLGQRSWGALLGAAGQAALVALLARIGQVDAPTRTRRIPDPPRTEE